MNQEAQKADADFWKKKLDQRLASNAFYKLAYQIHNHYMFRPVVLLVVLLSSANVAADHESLSEHGAIVCEYINLACFLALALECLIKIAAYGFISYLQFSYYHVLDLLLVLVGVCDAITVFGFLTPAERVQSVQMTCFKTFRICRLFKLQNHWGSFQVLLETLRTTLTSILPFFCLLAVLVYTFTLVGLELFAYRAKLSKETGLVDLQEGESPAFNFDTFLDSFTVVFLILINDIQSIIFYDYYRAVSGVKATLYWLTFIIVGSKIMLNLFIAILLQNFTVGNIKAKVEET